MHPPRLRPAPSAIAVAWQAVGTVPLPRTLVPMKATSGDLPVGEGWTYEVKWDGMRALCFVDGDRLRVQSYNERDVTVSWPELAGLPDALPAATALLDGELVATDGDGRPSFGLLQQRMHVTDPAEAARRSAEVPVAYVAFDLLHLDGHDLTGLPLTDRRRLLDQVLEPGPRWRCSPLHDDGLALLDGHRSERGLEGVVAKRLDSRYEPGKRTRTWLKVKVRLRQEMVVGGWLPGEGNRTGRIGALLVGYHDAAGDGPLRFAGTGRHRASRTPSSRGSAGCSTTWPPTSAPSTRRRPAPRSCAGPAGSAPSWWPSSSSASGPPTAASGTRATSACATDKAADGRHDGCLMPERRRSSASTIPPDADLRPVVEVAVAALVRRSGRPDEAVKAARQAVRGCLAEVAEAAGRDADRDRDRGGRRSSSTSVSEPAPSVRSVTIAALTPPHAGVSRSSEHRTRSPRDGCASATGGAEAAAAVVALELVDRAPTRPGHGLHDQLGDALAPPHLERLDGIGFTSSTFSSSR